MPSPSSIPYRACVCTVNSPAITSAGIQYAVSQCGEFVTVSQIISALGLDPVATQPGTETDIRAWLDDNGWERVKKLIGGARVWGYERPANNDAQLACRKEELLMAIVNVPQPGQLLMPMLIRRPYAAAQTVELVDLNALQRDLALSLLSADNSLNIASTSAALDELSTALASALALCKRSKAAMNSSAEPGATSMDCNSLSRTSKASSASVVSFSSMDSSPVLSKNSHGTAGLAKHLAGGAL